MDQTTLALDQSRQPHPGSGPGIGSGQRAIPGADRRTLKHLASAGSPGPAENSPDRPPGRRNTSGTLARVDAPATAGGSIGLPELHQPADRGPAGDLTADGQIPYAQPSPPPRHAQQNRIEPGTGRLGLQRVGLRANHRHWGLTLPFNPFFTPV